MNGPALLKEKDKPKRDKLPKLSTVRNKCDSYLTPIIKNLYPVCLLCNQYTQVGHHFIKKSESLRLRYELLNIINLCNHCHCALHSHEGLYSARIVAIKGVEWFNKLEEMKKEPIKADVHHYIRQKSILEQIQKATS